MRLTPLDIRKQEFRKAMRGLDPEEVYAFLATIADEYEAVLNDNKALRERLLELDDKVQEYRNMEKTLRDTLLTAERATAEAKNNARREAELIVKQAEIDAERSVRDITNNAMKLRQEVQSLKRQRDSYLARMKMLAESQLKFLDTAESDFKDDDALLNEVEERVSRHVEDVSPRSSRTPSSAAPAPDRASASAAPAPATAAPSEPRSDNALPSTPASDVAPAGAVAPASLATPNVGTATTTPVAPPAAQAPLSELLDQVIEGQRAVADQAREDANTPSAVATEAAESPAGEADAPVDTRKWSLDRLKGDIADHAKSDEED